VIIHHGYPMDEILVKSLGFTKVYDILQSYKQLQLFLLAFPDTFIIDIKIGGDKQWQGTWRDGRKRPLDGSDLIIYNRIGVVHPRQSYEAWGMMESILIRGT
jgi:hypothetical protein